MERNNKKIKVIKNLVKPKFFIPMYEFISSSFFPWYFNQSVINILGKGEEFLAIDTPDNTKQPANRRVEIKKSN